MDSAKTPTTMKNQRIGPGMNTAAPNITREISTMFPSVPERLAVVETKVGEIQAVQGEIGEKVNAIYDHMVAGKANRKLATKFFGGIAGFVGVAAALAEIFRK